MRSISQPVTHRADVKRCIRRSRVKHSKVISLVCRSIEFVITFRKFVREYRIEAIGDENNNHDEISKGDSCKMLVVSASAKHFK